MRIYTPTNTSVSYTTYLSLILRIYTPTKERVCQSYGSVCLSGWIVGWIVGTGNGVGSAGYSAASAGERSSRMNQGYVDR